MFNGIIEEVGTVTALEKSGESARLFVRAKMFELSAEEARKQLGRSFANSGVCLSAISFEDGTAGFDLASETLRATTLGTLKVGDKVNLERALEWGGRIDGHLVQGHVDTVAGIVARTEEQNTLKFVIELPASIKHLLAAKGSIAISGVSLTVGEVQENNFSVYIIPQTVECTTFKNLRAGDKVNLEVDVLARYTARILEMKR